MILSVIVFQFVLAKTLYQLNPCIVNSGNTEARAFEYIDILLGFKQQAWRLLLGFRNGGKMETIIG